MGVPEVEVEERARQSGHALYTRGGYVTEVDSCEPCAKFMRVPWRPALFEGVCRGCEVPLTGSPIEE